MTLQNLKTVKKSYTRHADLQGYHLLESLDKGWRHAMLEI
jgi:hypothetical protein